MKNKKKNISESPFEKHDGKNYGAGNSLLKRKSAKMQMGEGVIRLSVLKEQKPSYSISSKMRQIGNSKGVILPNRVIEEACISPEADLIIQVCDGVILIAQAKSRDGANTDLSTWDEQFKNAIKMGNKPETDVWGGMQNHFDEEEWA